MKTKLALCLFALFALPLPLLAAGSLDQCTHFLQRREFDHALTAGTQALQETDPHNHQQISAAHLCIGAALKQAGAPAKAMEELAKVRDLGADDRDVLVATSLMAAIYLAGGEQTTALQYYHEAARLAREQKNRPIESAMLRTIGNLFYDRKDADHALQYFEQAVRLGGDTDAAMMDAMASIYSQKKMLPQALGSEMRAVELAQQQHLQVWSGRYELALGELYRLTKQFDKAAPLMKQAFSEAEKANDRPTQASALKLQGQLALDTGNREEAARLFLAAQNAYTQIGDKLEAYRLYQQRQALLPEKPKPKGG